MTFSTITYVVEAGIARLTLNRPERLNSFTEEMHAEIRLALAALDADRSVLHRWNHEGGSFTGRRELQLDDGIGLPPRTLGAY